MHVDRLLLAFLVPLLCAIPSVADTVVLTNGDTLTGTLTRMEDETLILESELLETVRIPWSAVDSFASDRQFLVLTDEGERLAGTLVRRGDELTVGIEGADIVELPAESVARVVPGKVRKGPFRLLGPAEGIVDYGYSLARGNQSQMQSSLGGRATYRSDAYEVSGRLDSLLARQDGARAQSRHSLGFRVDRYWNARTFSYGLSDFERNERRNLDLRTQLGGGFGRRLRRSKTTNLLVLGGFAYVHERFRHAGNRVTGEGSFGVEWETRLFDFIELVTEFSMHPNLGDRGRVRLEYDSTLHVPVWGRVTYSLRLFDRFDSRPAARTRKNDYGISSGLGLTF